MHPIGTEVWVYSNNELASVPCVFDAGDLSEQRHVIDRTSLSYEGERFKVVAKEKGQELNFQIAFSDSDIFLDSFNRNEEIQIYIGLKGESEPAEELGRIIPPIGRRGWVLTGKVIAISAPINSDGFIVRTVTFKVSNYLEFKGDKIEPGSNDAITEDITVIQAAVTGGIISEYEHGDDNVSIKATVAAGEFQTHEEVKEIANISAAVVGGEFN